MEKAQFSVTDRTIQTIINYIREGEISIPEIQRPFVWDSSKIRDLIDSLYRGFPVGYLIVWHNPSVVDKNGVSAINKKIMIDGQQRVTALMTAICGLEVFNKDYKKVTYRISFNPLAKEDEPRFEVQNAQILRDKRWIPDISKLFDTNFSVFKFIRQYLTDNPDCGKDEDDLEKEIRSVTDIRNVPIGIIELGAGLNLADVTEIFIRINNTGKKLTQTDFVMSTIAADNLHDGNLMRKAIDYFCHMASNPNFLSTALMDEEFHHSNYYAATTWISNYMGKLYLPTYDDILRVSFMTQYYRAKLESLTELLHGRNFVTRRYEEEILEDSFKKLSEGILATTNKHLFQQFMETLKSAGFVLPKLLINRRNAINFVYALFIRLNNDKDIDKTQIKHYVRKWFVMSVLTGRYTNSPESQMDRDLRDIRERGFIEFYNDVMANLGDTFWSVTLPQDLRSSSTNTPAYAVYLASQCRLGDDSFLMPGLKVRDLLESGDIHHIFPKDYLKSNGYNYSTQYNQVANYVPLNRNINISIKNDAPNVYFKHIYDACAQGVPCDLTSISNLTDLATNCAVNCIPAGLETMTVSDYESFLVQRRKLMAQKIKDYFYTL